MEGQVRFCIFFLGVGFLIFIIAIYTYELIFFTTILSLAGMQTRQQVPPSLYCIHGCCEHDLLSFALLAAFYEAKVATLGEDPLREDADAEAAWQKISTSKKPIGLLLMDQSVIAGVGNIYRAEICFKAGISPEQPGNTLTRATWDEIWKHCVLLLQRGFQTGSILTVEPEEATILGPPWTRRYIYNQSKCGRCKGSVQTWDMAGRKVYACVQCQPLVAMDGRGSGGVKGATAVLPAARRKALAAAVTAVEFVSHCAPDDVADVATPPSKLTVAQLKLRLTELGLSTSGNKKALLQRLVTAHHVVAKPGEESPSDGGEEKKKVADERVGKNVSEKSPSSPVKLSSLVGGVQAPTPPVKEASTLRRKRASTSSGVARRGATDRVTALIPGNVHPSSSSNGDVDGDKGAAAAAAADAVFPEVYTWDYTTPVCGDADGGNTVKGAVSVRPGIAGVPRERVATAAEAAAEKAEAGENRAVEHVALQDEETSGKVDGMGVGGAHARRTRRRL
jgi:hypothetical protein